MAKATSPIDRPVIQIRRMHESAITPTRATPASAGLDLYSPRDYVIRKHGNLLVNLELKVDIPEGYFGKIEGKSSLAYHYKIDVGAGVIDQDYVGHLHVLLFNHSDEHFLVDRGDQIAQLIIQPIILPEPVVVIQDCDSARKERTEGFGATSGCYR